MSALVSQAEQIALQNDLFRSHLGVCRFPGAVMTTQGIGALPVDTQALIFQRLRLFDQFSEDNDPHGEHDFGAIEIEGQRNLWKIDYYADSSCTYGSEDPGDPARCYRVMTIMLAHEY